MRKFDLVVSRNILHDTKTNAKTPLETAEKERIITKSEQICKKPHIASK